MQDADALYNKLVKGAQAQASILNKVENELKSLSGTAQELQKVEQKLESMAKELGVDLDTNYEASTWVKDLSKYANEVGVISNKL
jgi:conjugal transfer/entry exclusion protein